MSHGNSSKNQSESRIDKLNNILGRLMGKRDNKINNNIPNNTPSNMKFMLIVAGMIIFLWSLTGVYYVPDGNYGLIMYNGKTNKVVSGLAIGVARPYPFSDVAIINSEDSNLSIGKDEANKFIVVSKDDHNIQLVLETSYALSDPKLYFNNFYQEISDTDNRVKLIVMSFVQKYVQSKNESELSANSKLVIANEVCALINNNIAQYGLKLNKINIVNMNSLPVGDLNLEKNKEKASNSSIVLQELIDEANNYALNKNRETESLTAQFNELLPQYRSNPQTIRELMYYKMLSSIPESDLNYKLLNLSESQFLIIANSTVSNVSTLNNESQSQRQRNFTRTVKRERIFQD